MRCWKSSFVNAIRGVKDDDEEASMVDAIEGTMEPKPYPHPSFPNIKIWDLPNRTPKFQAKEYLKKVNFERYDIFIMVISERFTENNAFLAKEIQRMKKKLYYVRSKMDISVQNEKRNKNFNMEETLKSIRNYCQDSLKSTGVPSPRVFLISSREAYKYDFPLLKETIAVELPDHKKDILTLSVHIFSEKELMKKKELMKAYIKKIADILCLWSRSYGKEFEDLRSAIKKTPLANVDAELVFSLLMKSSLWVAVSLVEMVLDIIPLIGSLFGGASSYIVTYHFLNSFLDDAVEDARNVQREDGRKVPRGFQDPVTRVSITLVKPVFWPGQLDMPSSKLARFNEGGTNSRGLDSRGEQSAKGISPPSSPNIMIWELPEIRERNSKAAEYFKKVQFERYDVFIMVVTDRFTENDAFLATEIQRMRKKFYCMRSKMDISIESERRKRNFSMEKTLETIRNYCEDNLRESAKLPARVFLVSNLHAHMYEFPLLREKMATELPDYKKHIFTLATQVFSEDNLMDKKIKMKPCTKYLAFISCVCGAVPVVGLSLACDIGIVMVALKCFWKVLGIDQRSLRFLALQTGKGFEELRSEIKKRPLVKTISAQLALSLLMKSALWVRPLSVKYLGMVFGGVSSFFVTYCFLNKFLDNAVENARKVRTKLLK
ncbi:putative Interferon-inducible GTPase 5-like protein [Naja naja]|nr:putative Interferon-inducible GTPase 5-like protein [Naja naja]